MTSHTGISSRVIELEGVPFDTEDKAREMYDILKEQWGTAGEFFIHKFIEIYGNELKKVKEEIEGIKQLYKAITNKKISSHLEAISLIIFIDSFISKYLFKESNEDASFNLGYRMLEKIQNLDDVDITEKAYKYVQSWLLANSNNFHHEAKEVFGVIDRKGKDTGYCLYCVFPHLFENELKRQNFPVEKIKKEFQERGYIISEKGRFTTRKYFMGDMVRLIAIKIPYEEDEAE